MNQVFSAIKFGRYQPGVIMGEHVHDDASLSLVLAGGYEERIRGRNGAHEAGSLLVCPPHEPHAQRFGPKGLLKLVLSPTEATLARLDDMTCLADAPALRAQAVQDVGRRIAVELDRDDAFSATVIEGLSLELIGLFARSHAARPGPVPHHLRRATDYLHQSAGAPVSLDAAARAAGCGADRLSEAFRRYLGCTFGDYQRRLRIERAAALLASTRLPITEIALVCGFSDQPHLTRAFQSHLGTTPAAYRRNCR